MFKLIEEMTARLKSPSWREQQQLFSKEKVEFIQDQRILNFFDQSPILGIGDIEYFKNTLNIVNKKNKCNQCLTIINKKTLDLDLIKLLKELKNIKKICISINKFLIYTQSNNKNIVDDYDEALLILIKKVFKNRNIEHHFIKNLKGDSFNFASPTTQFFIT